MGRAPIHWLVASALTAVVVMPRAGQAGPIGGRAFVDADGDGLLSIGDPTVAGVYVAWGHTLLTTTDQDGYFEIDAPDEAGLIWLRAPAGYRPGPIWAEIPAEGGSVDLALVPSGAPAEAPFAVASDLHVGKPRLGGGGSIDDADVLHSLDQIARTEPLPRFIALTGDLVQANAPEHYAMLKLAGEATGVPLVPVPGNHDWFDGGAAYRAAFGPDMYSFDDGAAHFVVLNDNASVEDWTAFLALDAATVAAGTPIIAFIHRPPEQPELEALEAAGIDYLFTGHWHSNMMFEFGDLVQLNTEPLIRGGIDGTPAGYRLVAVQSDGSLQTSHHTIVDRTVLRIVSPATNQCMSGDRLDIVASVQLGSQLRSVIAELDGQRIPLAKTGPWTWTASARLPRYASPLLRIDATTIDGDTETTMQPIAPCQCEIQPTAGQWLQVQGDGAHTGYASHAIVPPLSTQWSAELGGHPSGAPVVAGGLVIVGLADLDRGEMGGVVALDLATGRVRWRFHAGIDVRAPPAVDGQTVVAASADGTVYGIDLATGAERWAVDLSVDLPTIATILHAPPVVADGIAYVGVQRRWAAIDVASGSLVWAHDPAPNQTTLTSRAAGAVVGQQMIATVGRSRDGLFAWDRDSGAELWRLPPARSIGIHAAPVSDGETVYLVNAAAEVMSLDAASGSLHWMTQVVKDAGSWDYSVLSTPALAHGRLLVPTQYDALVALNAASGRELWRIEGGDSALHDAHARTTSRSFPSSPIVTGDIAWVIGGDGWLRALSILDGSTLWSQDIGVPGNGGIAAAGDYLVVATFDGSVRAMHGLTCPPPPVPDDGCGCQAGHSNPAWLMVLLLIALGWPVVSRRRI